MKNRINVLIMLGIMAFGGFMAYSSMKPTTVYADPPPIYRFTDIPKEKSVINLDLNNNTFALEGTADVEINIQKEDEVRTITKWKNRIIKDTVLVADRMAPFAIKLLSRDLEKVVKKIHIPEVSNLNEVNIR